nr:hypothetical protein MIMGU_mgv1a024924mg [Ipomoea batatas]
MAGGGETTLPVVNGGDGTGPTAHYGGGFVSKWFKKGKNAVLNCITICSLNNGENRRGAPTINEISGAGDEKPPENPIIAMTENQELGKATWPRVASFAEQAGMGSVFLGLHMLVANYLSPELRFFPVICWGFSVLPFVAAAIPAGGGADQDDVCPV